MLSWPPPFPVTGAAEQGSTSFVAYHSHAEYVGTSGHAQPSDIGSEGARRMCCSCDAFAQHSTVSVSFMSARSTLQSSAPPVNRSKKPIPLSPSRKVGNRPPGHFAEDEPPNRGRGTSRGIVKVNEKIEQKSPLSAGGTLTAWLRPPSGGPPAPKNFRSESIERKQLPGSNHTTPVPIGPPTRAASTPSNAKPSSTPDRLSLVNTDAPSFPAKLVPSNRIVQEDQTNATPPPYIAVNPSGTKRRLGMGRTAVGYPNKKFRAPA